MTFENVHPQKVDYLIPPLLCPPKMIESQTYRRKVCYVAVEVVVGAAKEAGEEKSQQLAYHKTMKGNKNCTKLNGIYTYTE